MTSTEVLSVLLRRWYVVVAGLALTVAAAVSIHSDPGVYSTQADVVFLAPRSHAYPNPIGSTSESLIATAGLVARVVNDGRVDLPTASSGVSLTSEGIRQGWSIRLPDSGGQWSNGFDRPVLDVQVAGPSPEWVTATLDTRIRAIESALLTMQESEDIPRQNFIFTSVAPGLASVRHSAGSPGRAIAAAVLLGSTLAALAALAVDRIARDRRRTGVRA